MVRNRTWESQHHVGKNPLGTMLPAQDLLAPVEPIKLIDQYALT